LSSFAAGGGPAFWAINTLANLNLLNALPEIPERQEEYYYDADREPGASHRNRANTATITISCRNQQRSERN
jgi:hypothetical protein